MDNAPPHPAVGIVILNWNGGALTLNCLEHIRLQTRRADTIVVDNGSTDGSVELIRARSPVPFELVRLPHNVGFAAGMNAGIQAALRRGAAYVWLLNNDAFPEPECLSRLLRVMEDQPGVGAVSPQLLSADGTEQHAGGVIDWATGKPGFRLSHELAARAEPGTWLSGTALLIRATSLAAVGLLDSEFFAYWEDVDLSLRLGAAGVDLRAVPEALLYHDAGSTSGGASSPTVHFLDTRNEWRVVARYAPSTWQASARRRYFARKLRRAGLLEEQGERAAAVATLRGMAAAMFGRFGPPPPQPEPGWLTRTVLAHPWRLASMIEPWTMRSQTPRSDASR